MDLQRSLPKTDQYFAITVCNILTQGLSNSFSFLWFKLSITAFSEAGFKQFILMDDIILSGCFTYVSRSSHQSCSIQKPALKKFAIFTGKNLGPTLGSHFKVLGHGSHLRVVGHIFPVCLQLFLQKNFIVDIRLGSIYVY